MYPFGYQNANCFQFQDQAVKLEPNSPTVTGPVAIGLGNFPWNQGQIPLNLTNSLITQTSLFGGGTPFKYTSPEKPAKTLDLTKPIADQRPVLRRTKLKRAFEPHRARVEYSHIACPKERRRLRSLDNAKLYRDREKQRIMDLENQLQDLQNKHTTLLANSLKLKTSYDTLEQYLNQNYPQIENRLKEDALLEETTQAAADQTGLTSYSNQSQVAYGNEKRAMQILQNSNQSSSHSSNQSRNKLNLKLDLTASSNSSSKTVINVLDDSDMTSIGAPRMHSSAIEPSPALTTPSNYGSAGPSPADLEAIKSHGLSYRPNNVFTFENVMM